MMSVKAMREASSIETWTNSQPDTAAVGLARAIAGDAVADMLETAERLDAEMNEAAGLIVLITPDRLGRFEIPDARQARSLQDPADRCRRDANHHSDVLAGQPFPPQRDDAFDGGRRSRTIKLLGS
jgi:hypothetical protein